jgi:hypothetical protein
MTETLASASVVPLPAYTDIAPSAAEGRIAEKTGIPTLSSPEMSAIRVTPTFGTIALMRFNVSFGGITLWVSMKYAFGDECSSIRAVIGSPHFCYFEENRSHLQSVVLNRYQAIVSLHLLVPKW